MRQFLYLSALTIILLRSADLSIQAAEREIVTSRSQFTIPFRFDQQELKRLNAQKVHLFLSRDRGQTWKQVDSAGLNEKQFLFQPDSDGDYWFSVAVSDAEQVMHPEPSLAPPGLKIIVDRTRAEMDLNVQLKPGRRLELSWRVNDAHPLVDSLELKFRNSADDKWIPVYVKKQLAGKTSWRIQAGQYPEIRGRFTDAAGNVTEKIVKLTPAVHDQIDQLPGEEVVHARNSAGPAGNPHSIQLSSASNVPAIEPMTASPRHSKAVQTSSGWQTESLPEKTAAPASGLINQSPWKQQTVASPVSQSEYQHLETTRYMNAHQFDIDYQVAGVGPSGVGVVELFVTQDNGRQWWRYGVDADLTSPMTVKVPEDGRYGFHFRIHSGVGNAEPPPQPGQKPQIDLIVDSSKPQIQLLNSFQGHGENINVVTVQWKFSDDHPAEKPISIFYSGSRLGPWEQTEGALKNTGTYSFTLPRNTPAKLHLKIVGRDAAGNIAETISEKPLLIDRARPTARVIMIEPVRQTDNNQ